MLFNLEMNFCIIKILAVTVSQQRLAVRRPYSASRKITCVNVFGSFIICRACTVLRNDRQGFKKIDGVRYAEVKYTVVQF